MNFFYKYFINIHGFERRAHQNTNTMHHIKVSIAV